METGVVRRQPLWHSSVEVVAHLLVPKPEPIWCDSQRRQLLFLLCSMFLRPSVRRRTAPARYHPRDPSVSVCRLSQTRLSDYQGTRKVRSHSQNLATVLLRTSLDRERTTSISHRMRLQ